ncbi:MAG: transposase [Patescibacteria group bacterium]
MTQRRIYQNECPYFVTFRTRVGFGLFEDEKMAELLSEIMFNAGRLKRFGILAYQIMPDHVHVLVQRMDGNAGAVWSPIAGADLPAARLRQAGTRDSLTDERHSIALPPQVSAPAVTTKPTPTKEYTISQFMYCIKSYFIKRIRVQYAIPFSIWHTRFYARIVSTHKYLETVIQYIKRNPVKTELPRKYSKIPYQYFNWRLIIGY